MGKNHFSLAFGDALRRATDSGQNPKKIGGGTKESALRVLARFARRALRRSVPRKKKILRRFVRAGLATKLAPARLWTGPAHEAIDSALSRAPRANASPDDRSC